MAAAGMRFCRECNNMLYPSQDREIRRLVFRCRNCGQAEDVEENCIYVNELVKDTRVQLDVLPGDVIDDPTLQRDYDVTCPMCSHNGAVFIRSQDGVKQSTLALIWVCLNRDCQVDEEGNRLPSYRWMGS
ncbi:DNA-directed RNA polymerase II subunit RPB9 [Phytophthora boehmeriae]|uniref:DNA-directed RNA polymerase II subunit RPB9 n=1 Tax=Phytophthora boehmeriae TaxID=109152 RepID=A0A8T1WXF6_9STRA|nr:DNA-directed RNA polymerase II subunit RPB9 [Phytophthora boehmeriae]